MSTRDEIIEQALALSPEDRAIVAEAIEQSLPREQVGTDEVAAAWCREIEQRLESYVRGDSPALAHDEAFDYLERTLSEMPPETCDAVVEMLERRLPPEELDATWSREIDRRIDEIERGEVELLDAEESIAESRRALAESRRRRANP
jgi:putative addiction module component (TIGR02574 family)